MGVDFKSAAVEYAAMGWRSFPLAPGTKVPAIKGGAGVKDATHDRAQIDSWARRFPGSNIGLACGDGAFVVIDIDPRNGADASMAAIAKRGYCFPPCPVAMTGGGGWHLFFAFDARIVNSHNRLGEGIDVKSSGGYVVASPSIVPPKPGAKGTGAYRWLVHPSAQPLPRLPIWAATMLAPPPRPAHRTVALVDTPKSINGLISYLSRAPAGERNNRLYWCACRAADMVKRHQISEGGAVSQLMAACAALGLPAKEAMGTIRSAFDA